MQPAGYDKLFLILRTAQDSLHENSSCYLPSFQGFQIVLSDGASLFSLNEKLQKIVSETKSKKKKKKMSEAEGNIVVRMSLGRVYHFLTFSSQSYPGILVAVHRAK